MDQIIYHNGCPDGFTAAYIAKKRYPEAKLVPRDHGTSIDVEQYRGKDVLAVDCNLRGNNDEVSAITNSYRVLDHHKSETEIMNKPYAVFDLNRSGAGLAWDYLFGKDSLVRLELHVDGKPTGKFLESEIEERPWWVNYVEDRDLWRFRLPNSREVNAFIMSHTYSVENWDKITKTDVEAATHAGMYILQQNQKNAEEVALQAQFGHFNGYRTAVVNAPYILASDVGEVLYNKPDVDIAVIWFERNDGKIQVSFRSKSPAGPDVGAIAVSFPGGGGHKHAAGIVLSHTDGRLLVDVILGRIETQEQINQKLDALSGLIGNKNLTKF